MDYFSIIKKYLWMPKNFTNYLINLETSYFENQFFAAAKNHLN